MYRVRNIVNRRESDVICHSVRRSRVPTSMFIICITYECGNGRSFLNNCNKVDHES